jgi:hypothetical protein
MSTRVLYLIACLVCFLATSAFPNKKTVHTLRKAARFLVTREHRPR